MKKKIVIIGGGIGGLSAGIYALKAGYEAAIYEKNPVAGGECMGWNRKGCHIDNCIHWLTGTDSSTSVWQVWNTMGALDKDTPYAATDKFYSSRLNGQEATLWKDLDRTERELIALSPEDEAEIKKFIQHVRYAESCTIPGEKPMDMMKIGDYIKMGKSMANMPKVMKEYGKTDLRGLAERFHSPLLKKLMTDYLPAEYTAYSFLVSYATMTSGNGNIPVGGSLAMTNRIIERFKAMGGELHTNTPVKRIITENGTARGIELENGEKVMADEVISAVDPSFLFGRLLDRKFMPKEFESAYSESKKYPTTSGFQIAFKTDDDISVEDTVFFGCEPVAIGSRRFDRIYVKNYGYDKTFAPEGKAVLQTNIPQSDEDFAYWKSLYKEEYKAKKQQLIEEVTKRIVTEFPELEGRLEFLDCWTPLTYERYCNAYHGAYMAFVTTPDSKQVKIKGVLKGLKNFYMAGQWIMSPGGLPIAAISGKFAVQRILKKEKRSIEI
ncbi:NAD(P)/FAD-dependent oxidoreductase [Ruminococcus sp.]|uniref:phytoene desaturase family protein n=1 Tax=Ruminococcus sp. TaxID=41978 RepID=UPI0025FBBC31|nr:NAD(P)/FAD-dependent oxidoreductase [Ruminococcus sp.]MBQ8967448.1 NAD(P)/FAD-dependent oxidoreductase [Ruminococcus sp.]